LWFTDQDSFKTWSAFVHFLVSQVYVKSVSFSGVFSDKNKALDFPVPASKILFQENHTLEK